MAQALAVGADDRAARDGVHEVVAVGDKLRAHGGQRDRDLGVVHAGRGQYFRDRNHAIRHVQVQLVTNPTGLETLAVALAADIAGVRQIGQHRLQTRTRSA